MKTWMEWYGDFDDNLSWFVSMKHKVNTNIFSLAAIFDRTERAVSIHLYQ